MIKEIYFAGGCFWGVEKYFSLISGIIETEVGYANGHTENPSYEDICSDLTGHAEAIRIVYNDTLISLDDLLKKLYDIIDPTAINRQGPDIGSQYRTGVYYTNPEEQLIIAASLAQLQNFHDKPITVENTPLIKYYKAEEYHQKYLDKNPGGYCHIPSSKFS